jgi:hypothetical protein
MGASVALAGFGLTGCRRPLLHGVPYSKGVEWQVPGNALHYATSMPRRGGALPLIATTYSGRPTKLDGNPNVPGFNGATDIFGQAAILDLYDPDRSQVVLKVNSMLRAVVKPQIDANGNTQDVTLTKDQVASAAPSEARGKDYVEATLDDFWKELTDVRSTYQKNGGDGLAILAEPSTSPTCERLRAALTQQFPKVIWAEYDPWNTQAGAETRQTHDFSKADVIVSLDCDFLGSSDGTPQSIAGFAAGRRKLGKTQETMSRLYVIEGRLSLTGSMADHRLVPLPRCWPQNSVVACPQATALRRSTIPPLTRGSPRWRLTYRRPARARSLSAEANNPPPFMTPLQELILSWGSPGQARRTHPFHLTRSAI